MHIDLTIEVSSDAMKVSFGERWDHTRYTSLLGEIFLDIAKHRMPNKWAMLENLENWQVRLPEQIESCGGVATQMVENGLTHCAFNVNDFAISEWILENMVPHVVAKSYFNSDSDCEKWLESFGYDMNFKTVDLNPYISNLQKLATT